MKFYIVLILVALSFGLQAQSENKCHGGSYDLVKPYLGTWKEYRVTPEGEELMGTLITKLDVMGCAIAQRFVQHDSSFVYQSLGLVNPTSGMWEETYVFSTGSTSVFQWVVDKDGGISTKRIGGSRAIDHVYRLKYVDTSKNEYSVIQQKSFDGGITWEDNGRTRIIRVEGNQ